MDISPVIAGVEGIAGQARNDGGGAGIAGQARNDWRGVGIAGQARNDLDKPHFFRVSSQPISKIGMRYADQCFRPLPYCFIF